MYKKLILIVIIFLFNIVSYSQNIGQKDVQKLNYTDINGQKQGHWKKAYPNGKTAYDGYFINDKPTGEFLRYFESGNISAKLKYRKDGEHSKAKLYYEDGKVAAEGNYIGKLKDSTWNYYAEDGRIAMVENFSIGKKHGKFIKYWENGNTEEETNWLDDIQVGMWRQYFESGKIKMETRLDKGKRTGLFYYYFESGQYEISGKYKNDLKDGVWIVFERNGKIKNQITYLNGKAINQDELDIIETEELKKLDQNKFILRDPEKFMNNINEYLRMQNDDNGGE